MPGGKGRYQQFQHGTVYWSPQTGARAVRGAIGDKYAALNYERSALGLPAGDETKLRAGAFQRFQGGQIYWTPKTPRPWSTTARSSPSGAARATRRAASAIRSRIRPRSPAGSSSASSTV
ncbi:LGFP repeat-containing protein [Tsukamurella sp. PLM1]|uniref:LGFP repeat-containing protein n=1 Tax=Tsukamurella sp. PLM1 TaxID=2929795 RepID=UPI0020C153F0|nr:hypothetical protein [Tsukamurella sp. PLM1]